MFGVKEIEAAVEELKAAGLEEFLVQEPTAGPLSRRSRSGRSGRSGRGSRRSGRGSPPFWAR